MGNACKKTPAAKKLVPPTAGPWSCAVCTFYNENHNGQKCAMCDTPKQVAPLRRQISFGNLLLEQTAAAKKTPKGLEESEYDRLSRSAATLTASALAGGGFGDGGAKTAGISDDGSKLIAGAPPGIIRMPSIEDDAGNGAPGSDKPLQQHLRAQSLRVRFANKSGVQDARARPPSVDSPGSAWVRKEAKNAEGNVWMRNTKRDSRRVIPARAQSKRTEQNSKKKKKRPEKSWVRVLRDNGKLDWLPANEFSDLETSSPISLSTSGKMDSTENAGVDSDLQYVASLPFKKKRVWFRECCKTLHVPWEEGHIELWIERDRIINSSFEQIMPMSIRDTWKIFKVQFIGEDGNDAGGVSREWFTELTSKLFSADFGLFRKGGKGDLTYHLNNMSETACQREKGDNSAGHLRYFKFVGRLLGKALLQDTVIDVHFALPIYKHLLGLPITIDDLQYIDEGLYLKVQWLQDPQNCIDALDGTVNSQAIPSAVAKGQTEGAAVTDPGPQPSRQTGENAMAYMAKIRAWNDQHINFMNSTKQRKKIEGTTKSPAKNDATYVFAYERGTSTHDLIPDGRSVAVTDINKGEYIMLLSKYRLLESVQDQLAALLTGFYEVIPPTLISIFTFQELELLLCGLPYVDIEDWKKATVYKEGSCFGKDSNTSKWFWEVVQEFDEEEQARLLQFCTGSSRVPVGGFSELQTHSGNTSPFTILGVKREHKMFPEAHTCFNRLELPMYTSKAELKKKLLVAIEMEMRLDLE